MSDSLSPPTAPVKSQTATNPNTPHSGDSDLNNSQPDDNKSVSAVVCASPLSPNLSAQEKHDLDVNNLEPDDNSLLDDRTATVNAPLSSNSSIQADYDPDVNDLGSDDSSVPDDNGGASRQRYHSYQPTWTTKIHETKIPAYACWHSEQKMFHMKLDIHWAKQQALFKLYTRLPLNQSSGSSRNAYIFIHPERINELVFTAEPTSEHFSAPIALTFSLNRLPTLVLPKTRFGFAQKAEGAISSLRNLVQQSSFTIYADLQRRRLSRSCLAEFCEEITKHKLQTIVSLANWTNLYQGTSDEADVIEGDSLLESVIHKEDATTSRPPAYEEGDPSVPLTHSTKRKERESSVPLTSPTKRVRSEDSSTVEQSLQDTVAVQTLFGDASDAKFVANDGERKPKEMLSAFLCALEEKISTLKRDVSEMLSTHKQEVKEMLSTHKQEVEAQVRDMTDALEDTLMETMEEKISDQMEEVQDSILQRVSSAYITIPGVF